MPMPKEQAIMDLLTDGFDETKFIEEDVNKQKGEAAQAASPEPTALSRSSRPSSKPKMQGKMHVVRLSPSVYAKLRIAKLIELKLSGHDGTVSEFIGTLIDERVKSMPKEYIELFRKLESLT